MEARSVGLLILGTALALGFVAALALGGYYVGHYVASTREPDSTQSSARPGWEAAGGVVGGSLGVLCLVLAHRAYNTHRGGPTHSPLSSSPPVSTLLTAEDQAALSRLGALPDQVHSRRPLLRLSRR